MIDTDSCWSYVVDTEQKCGTNEYVGSQSNTSELLEHVPQRVETNLSAEEVEETTRLVAKFGYLFATTSTMVLQLATCQIPAGNSSAVHLNVTVEMRDGRVYFSSKRFAFAL